MLRSFAGSLLGLVLLMSGCAGSATAPSAASGPPANAQGAWEGYAGMGAVSAPVTLTLTQAGGTVKGNINVAATTTGRRATLSPASTTSTTLVPC